MKVILLDNIKGVGKKDEVINASDGYARNFLFPKNLAVEANKENMAKLQTKKDSKQHQKDLEKEAAYEMMKKLKDITIQIPVKAGENGKIFGGVTAKEIAEKIHKLELTLKVKAVENGKIFGGITSKEISEELKKQNNIEVDKKKIDMKETIKNLGIRTIEIKLFEGVIGKLKVDVISDK